MLRHSRKNNLSCFKALLVTGLWDKILTSLLRPIQRCSSKFWAWSCIASNFDKGRRGCCKHKIMDRPFKPKYGTVSQVLLQLVVASSINVIFSRQCQPKWILEEHRFLGDHLFRVKSLINGKTWIYQGSMFGWLRPYYKTTKANETNYNHNTVLKSRRSWDNLR